MSFADKQLTCRDCSKTFLFTSGEQEFYASKGLQNEPVRCPPCRSARKSNRLTEPEEGYVRYGVFASFGGRTPRQMHPATCADCGMMTEVPFQPRGDRPVYCSSCYNKIKGAQEGPADAAAKPEAASEPEPGTEGETEATTEPDAAASVEATEAEPVAATDDEAKAVGETDEESEPAAMGASDPAKPLAEAEVAAGAEPEPAIAEAEPKA